MALNPTITVSESGDSSFIKEAIGTLQNAKVYVGIPEAETLRKGKPITNAALLFVHTNGSPLRHIPATPVIEPSIEANHEEIESGLHEAASYILDGQKVEAKETLAKVGTLGANGAKKWFVDPRNGWRQNSPETIKRKLSKLTGQRLRKALDVLNSVDEHMPLYGTTELDAINTPLIDTGEMRRAITHVEEMV